MTQPVLNVDQRMIDWPLNQPIDSTNLLQRLGAHATDSDGQDLTNKIVVNLTQVDINQLGAYPVMLSVMDSNGQSAQTSVTINVQAMRTQEATSQTPIQQKTKHG